jgi:hypothetical protein
MSTSNPFDPSPLPTLQALRRKTPLTAREVAEAAGVPLRIEYVMEIGGVVSQQEAEKVLAAFSRLTGETYSLTNVQVHLAHQAARLPDQRPQVRPTVRCRTAPRKAQLLS